MGGEHEVRGLQLVHDGDRFVYSSGGSIDGEPGFHGRLATISNGTVLTTSTGYVFAAARVASTRNGRSLLVSTVAEVEPTLAVAPVLDAP